MSLATFRSSGDELYTPEDSVVPFDKMTIAITRAEIRISLNFRQVCFRQIQLKAELKYLLKFY